MRTSDVVLIVTVFAASLVEMVEALTLVVAAGTTRGWRSALEGVAAALVVLSTLVLAIGVPLIHYVPINTLRVVVGAMLLLLGMGWLRKAWLRSSDLKAKHDEDQVFRDTVSRLSSTAKPAAGRDGVAFAIAFKGVFLEGTEVVLIVISLGASSHRLGLATLAALGAVVVVAVAGLVLVRQLSVVPENTLKAIVGVFLCSFGLFWVGEGSGMGWPGHDASLLVLIGIFAASTLVAGRALRRDSVAP